MHLLDECGVWLQTHIDGDNAARFLALVQNWKEKLVPAVMPDVNPSHWLVEFWLSQMAMAGIQVTPQQRNHAFNVMNEKGMEGFMRTFKTLIEEHNLPRIPKING
ncbi:hypothetical protein [Vibrio phage vB_pir03]|nr:hypothetical protein [Vibrio phage vB_pir03]